MTEPHCENCKYGIKKEGGLLTAGGYECHRFLVQAGATGSTTLSAGFWPTVMKPPFWCGEFKERSA